jgi:hypothetical protein
MSHSLKQISDAIKVAAGYNLKNQMSEICEQTTSEDPTTHPFNFVDNETIGKGNVTIILLMQLVSAQELPFDASSGECTMTIDTYKVADTVLQGRIARLKKNIKVPFLTINEVALLYKLNQEQYWPFSIFCRHWLLTKAAAINDVNAAAIAELARLEHELGIGFIVQGKAGSGKTKKFIDAAVFFVASYNLQNTLQVGAFTGIAAVTAGAETIHTLLEISIHETINDKRVTPAQIDKWNLVTHLILDEAGTTSASLLRRIHSRLCALKQEDTKFFGGVFLVLVQDISQLPPTEGTI